MSNVALQYASGRQSILVAIQDIAFNNLNDSGVPVSTIFKLPPKAVLIGGAIDVITPSNDTGASTLNIGDAISPTRYAAAVNLKTAGRTSLSLTDYLSDGGDMVLTPTNTGTATAGVYRMHVSYVIEGRATENQPN